MRVYAYNCGACGIFEASAGLDDSELPCPTCHKPARRRPYSSLPALRGETVVKSIPDESYKREAMKRDSRASGWDVDRAVRSMRQNLKEDGEGNKVIDLKQAAHAS